MQFQCSPSYSRILKVQSDFERVFLFRMAVSQESSWSHIWKKNSPQNIPNYFVLAYYSFWDQFCSCLKPKCDSSAHWSSRENLHTVLSLILLDGNIRGILFFSGFLLVCLFLSDHPKHSEIWDLVTGGLLDKKGRHTFFFFSRQRLWFMGFLWKICIDIFCSQVQLTQTPNFHWKILLSVNS